jgi:DNA invertase Pin-like site-specific DNA recombinase
MKRNQNQKKQESGESLNLAYTRVSTVFQEDNMSTEVQSQHIAATAALNDETVHQWLHDTDSGGNDDRVSFNKMMDLARAGKVSKIYVYSLDRFARNLLHSEQAHHELQKLGVKVVSVREHLTDGPVGNLLRQKGAEERHPPRRRSLRLQIGAEGQGPTKGRTY